jgi:cytochrome P450
MRTDELTVPGEPISDELVAQSVVADSSAYFNRLREEDPVHYSPVGDYWLVSRHADVARGVRDHHAFSKAIAVDPRDEHPPVAEGITDEDAEFAVSFAEEFRPFPLSDPPEHTVMRNAFRPLFTPRALEIWRQKLRAAASAIVDNAFDDGGMELKNDFALPIPLTTISLMLDVPLSDASHLQGLTEALMRPGFGPERYRAMAAAFRELQSYFSPLIEARRTSGEADLISLLADGERRGIFTRNQSLSSTILFMAAGHETTMSQICHGTVALIRNPDQWSLLRSDPDRLAPGATEESLRYEPAPRFAFRTCTTGYEFDGGYVPAGARVQFVLPAANRDPRVFADPDRFDILRSPNPHVSFGGGIHHCLGAALTRIEIQEALKVLVERFPRLDLAVESLEYLPSTAMRTPQSVPVCWN